MQALPEGGYDARTRKNVQDSDGTVIIHFGPLRGGTATTLHYCLGESKPHLLLDGVAVAAAAAAARIAEFYDTLPGGTLNFAGPRASEAPQAYGYTSDVVTRFLTMHADGRRR